MTIERKTELRKFLLKMICFSGGAILAFSAGSCAAKSAGKEELDSTKIYYVAPIAMKNESGETIYVAPEGFTLAYDENGKPYCYKSIIIDDFETIKTLKKSK